MVETSQYSCIGAMVLLLNILLDYPSIILNVVSDGEIYDTLVEVEWEGFNYIGYPDSVNIYRRIHFSTDSWDLLAKVPFNDNMFVNYGVATHEFSYEYKVGGSNACSYSVETLIHNTILLNGSNNESGKTIDLSWNRYYGWQQGVNRYK